MSLLLVLLWFVVHHDDPCRPSFVLVEVVSVDRLNFSPEIISTMSEDGETDTNDLLLLVDLSLNKFHEDLSPQIHQSVVLLRLFKKRNDRLSLDKQSD